MVVTFSRFSSWVYYETMMKRGVLILLVLAAAVSGCNFKMGPLPPIEVYFSPKGGATEAVVGSLGCGPANGLRPGLQLHFQGHCPRHS